jgi:predicted phosphate transport protein (TIGR00153 family)
VALTPKDAVLFDLYTSLAERVAAGARSATEMINGPVENRKDLAKRIGAIESEADDLLGKIIRRVDDMFVTPYDRGDLQELANKLDDAMDEIEEATDLIILHDVQEFPQGLSDLVDAVRRLAELTASSMPRLKNLKDLDHYYSEADRIETEGDRIHRRVTAMLFSGNFDALTILRINGVIDAFEEALDEMARVARTIRTIALKES